MSTTTAQGSKLRSPDEAEGRTHGQSFSHRCGSDTARLALPWMCPARCSAGSCHWAWECEPMKWILLSVAVFLGSVAVFVAMPRSALLWVANSLPVFGDGVAHVGGSTRAIPLSGKGVTGACSAAHFGEHFVSECQAGPRGAAVDPAAGKPAPVAGTRSRQKNGPGGSTSRPQGSAPDEVNPVESRRRETIQADVAGRARVIDGDTIGCSSDIDSSCGTFAGKRHHVVGDDDVLRIGLGEQCPRLVEA